MKSETIQFIRTVLKFPLIRTFVNFNLGIEVSSFLSIYVFCDLLVKEDPWLKRVSEKGSLGIQCLSVEGPEEVSRVLGLQWVSQGGLRFVDTTPVVPRGR